MKKAEKLILGNIITMDDTKPYAEAVVVTDGIITYVGGKKTAKTLCDENTTILDYGENYVYPDFAPFCPSLTIRYRRRYHLTKSYLYLRRDGSF